MIYKHEKTRKKKGLLLMLKGCVCHNPTRFRKYCVAGTMVIMYDEKEVFSCNSIFSPHHRYNKTKYTQKDNHINITILISAKKYSSSQTFLLQ